MAPFREPSEVKFDAVANFRDLGGHTTRDGGRVGYGRLFRSGHLAHATEADVARLERLGLRRVFDFRTRADIEAEGSDLLPGSTTHRRLPMPDLPETESLRSIIQNTEPDRLGEVFGNGKAAAMMTESAAGLVRDRREAYREFLMELSSSEALPALFHCSAGKDRAGWAGSLVLLTLGVDEEQVIDQYLLSNRAVDEIRQRLSTNREGSSEWGGRWAALMQPFLDVRREYIEASFTAVREDWGSFDRYLSEGLGFSDEQRGRLRERMLE